MIARLLLIIALATLPFLSAKAESAEDAEAFVNQKKHEIVAKFGVSDKTAETYLRVTLSAFRASEAAKKDGTEVSRLHAEMLEKYATVILFGDVVVVRGTLLIDEMKDGVPGTAVPEPLVRRVNAWASFAAKVLVMSADAGETATAWATQRAVKSGHCDVHGKSLNFVKCEEILRETLDTIHEVMEHMTLASKAIGVLVLTVPRMTY